MNRWTTRPRDLAAKLVIAAAPIAFFLLAEAGARLDFQWRRGYTYFQALAYLPEPSLVFRVNPHHHRWQGKTSLLPILKPPAPASIGRFRLWVLGGSTSEPQPDQSDWPAVAQGRLGGADIINMAHSGYGTSQMTWLYRTYRHVLRPDAVVLFEGWNGRGAAASPYAWHPANTATRFSTVAQRVSAGLINHSAFYGRVWHKLAALKPIPCTAATLPPPEELAAWASAYEALLLEVSRTDTTYVVLFPGLALRDDARDFLSRHLACEAATWPIHSRLYRQRLDAIRAIALKHRLTVLDVTQAYQRLPIDTFTSYFTDVAHQTPEGNRFLGETIATLLADRATFTPDGR